MSLARSAAAFYALIAALSERSRKRARAVWADLDRQQIAASWDASARDTLLAEVATAQQMAAIGASRFMGNALDQQGVEWVGELVNPRAIAGVASDGRDLDSLLFQPAIATMRRLNESTPPDEAFAMGAAELDAIVGTQVTDASRAAMQVEMASQPAVTGYVRMLTPPSCGRCAILAGRFYRWSDGFLRHPNCFPAGTVVSGPATRAAARRWYEGELTIVRTASGKQLSLTGNHPVLTDRGWLPARLLVEGDNVVGCASSDRTVGLLVPHEQQVPAPIEDVWRAGRVETLSRVPTSAEDFHGDGADGHVDVVLADRLLNRDPLVQLAEAVSEQSLSVGAESPGALPVASADFKGLVANLLPAPRTVGIGSLSLPLGLRQLARADQASLARVAKIDASVAQALADRRATHAESLGDGVLALTREVGGRDSGRVDRKVPSRWDAPAGPFTMESGRAYASIGEDLRLRLTPQVALDRIIEARSVEWSGHVYNLTSSEGWYSANGLIVSNCDCVHIPSAEDAAGDLRTDPSAYFESLTGAEQNKYFGKGTAEAIRQGADMNQVVNARNKRQRQKTGLYYVGAIEATTEGTTRRGVAGRQMIRAEGGDPTRRGARTTSPRLTPDAILRIADGDKTQAAALLKRYGYIL